MKFILSFNWTYDPLGVISSIRVEKKYSPYNHISKQKIEQYSNQEVWEEKNLLEVEEHVSSQIALELQDLKRKS